MWFSISGFRKTKQVNKFYYKKMDVIEGEVIKPQEWLDAVSSSVILCELHRREEINHSELSHCFYMHSHFPVTDMNISRRNTRCQKYFWLTYTQLAITERSVRKRISTPTIYEEAVRKKKKIMTSYHMVYHIVRLHDVFLNICFNVNIIFLSTLGTDKIIAVEKNLSTIFKGLLQEKAQNTGGSHKAFCYVY